jgi:flagellar biosynthesis protein
MSDPRPVPARPLAVALRYDGTEAPRVTAKGSGPIADQIVATAEAAGVTVEHNPVLAEALSHIELDDQIPEALYRAVAEVILYVTRQTR